MTFPSLACETCKRRRIKCDQTQPVCQKCFKSRRQCHGMRTSKDSMAIVHMENDFASGNRKRPRGPRPTSPPVTLSKSLPVDLKTQAIAYYLHNHVQSLIDAPSISKGSEDDVVTIVKSRADCPKTNSAITVLALILFGKTRNHPQAIVDACLGYQQLLRDVQVSVCSPAKCDIETSLFTIFCMGRYEDSVYSSTHSATRMWALRSVPHHDGALAVLRTSKSQEHSGRHVPDIVKHTRRGMIKSALMRNRGLPEWILDGRDFGEEGLELEYDRIVIKLVSLRRRLFCLRNLGEDEERESHEFALVALELANEAQELEIELKDWSSNFSSTWLRQEHVFPAEPGDRILYSYRNIAYASVWTKYYATRVLVNSSRLRALKIAHSSPDNAQSSEMSKSSSILAEMAFDFECSLPFCLSNVASPRAITDEEVQPNVVRWVAWPLTMALCAEELDDKHKAIFSAELTRLGRLVGYGVMEDAEHVLNQFKTKSI